MNSHYITPLLFCLLLYNFIFGQSDTADVVGNKDASVQPPSAEETVGEETDQTEKKDKASSPSARDVAYTKGNYTDVETLRKDAEILREQAKKLYERAKNIRSESEDMDDIIEDLEDEADDLEDQAEELLKQAGNLQTCIKLSEDADELLNTDSLQLEGDTTSLEGSLEERKMLMLKMRNSADELLIKAKKISVRVREMKESDDEKDNVSDNLENKAEALEEKADELEAMADKSEEEQNMLPLSTRFPFQIGHQLRFTSVPPYNDKEPHLLLLSGLNFSFYVTNFLRIGAEDIALRFSKTMYGKRTAISGSPVVAFSFFAARRFEFCAGLGTTIQGQVGGDKSYEVAFAPFVKLFNENWLTNRFSLGPVIKFNFCAKGDLFTRSIPFDQPKVLPEKAWWFDFGITYAFHF